MYPVFFFCNAHAWSCGINIHNCFGESIKSPYAEFTTKEPKKEDLCGVYQLSQSSIEQLHFPDSLVKKMSYQLNSDMTFEFDYFPEHDFGMSLSTYQVVKVKGTWSIEKDQGKWVLPMDFDTVKHFKTNEIEELGMNYMNAFIVNKNKPPYEIYKMIGDPDSWEGVTLVKKKYKK